MAALRFPDKGPAECLDFPVDFGDLLEPGNRLSPTVPPIVTIERPSIAESPINLTIGSSPGVFVTASGTESPVQSPERLDTVTVWLIDGTLGTTYTIKIEVEDDNVTPKPRVFVRRVKIKIKEKTE